MLVLKHWTTPALTPHMLIGLQFCAGKFAKSFCGHVAGLLTQKDCAAADRLQKRNTIIKIVIFLIFSCSMLVVLCFGS